MTNEISLLKPLGKSHCHTQTLMLPSSSEAWPGPTDSGYCVLSIYRARLAPSLHAMIDFGNRQATRGKTRVDIARMPLAVRHSSSPRHPSRLPYVLSSADDLSQI